jgi:ferritin-like metal-binding protein YciE
MGITDAAFNTLVLGQLVGFSFLVRLDRRAFAMQSRPARHLHKSSTPGFSQNEPTTVGFSLLRHSMSLFSSPMFDTLDDLLLFQVQKLYDAEQRLAKALKKMAEAAVCKHLVAAFNHHARETERHVARLEIIFRMRGMMPQTVASEAMKGMITDVEAVIHAEGEPEIKDAALIAAAQSIEHFEVAAYSSAVAFARQVALDEVARSLDEILDEEIAANQKLTEIGSQTPSTRPVESPKRATLSIPNRSSMLR